MAKIIQPKKLVNDIPVSMREWILLIPKCVGDNNPDAFHVTYEWIQYEYKEDIHQKLLIEEMLIGYKHKINGRINNFLIRIK